MVFQGNKTEQSNGKKRYPKFLLLNLQLCKFSMEQRRPEAPRLPSPHRAGPKTLRSHRRSRIVQKHQSDACFERGRAHTGQHFRRFVFEVSVFAGRLPPQSIHVTLVELTWLRPLDRIVFVAPWDSTESLMVPSPSQFLDDVL